MFAYKEILMPQSKYSVKCPYAMTPKFIVVHNTANDASAESEVKYMESNNNATSFHYAVDNATVVKAIPENRNAFHAGDGVNGKGNRYGVADSDLTKRKKMRRSLSQTYLNSTVGIYHTSKNIKTFRENIVLTEHLIWAGIGF